MADVEPKPHDAPLTAQPGGAAVHLRRARDRWRALPLPARVILWIVGIIFAVWLILFVTKGRFLKGPFERILSARLARQVEVGGGFQLYFAPIAIKFRAEGMRVANLPWASRPDLFRADLIDARIAPLSLIFGSRYRIPWLELRGAAADLEWSRDRQHNTWTLGDPDRKGEPMTLPLVRRALLAGTTMR